MRRRRRAERGSEVREPVLIEKERAIVVGRRNIERAAQRRVELSSIPSRHDPGDLLGLSLGRHAHAGT
jgi:hypothetical protein